MPVDAVEKHRHFLLVGVTTPERFSRSGGGGRSDAIPKRSRKQHGSRLLRHLSDVANAADRAGIVQKDAGVEPQAIGIQVEFESFADVPLLSERLARERSRIELRNVRQAGKYTCATVFVPDGKLVQFEKIFRDYLTEKKTRRAVRGIIANS